jgi:hypothetical protein
MDRRWSSLAFAIVLGCSGDKRDAPQVAPPRPEVAPQAQLMTVRIAGTVIDRATGKPVTSEVDVVLHSEYEITVRASANGTFDARIAPGEYRVFVRDEAFISVAMPDRLRLNNDPRAELAGVIDQALLPVLDARADVTGIELGVVAAADVVADVFDPSSRDIEGAVVRLRPADFVGTRTADRFTGLRPVLGTDSGISGSDGSVTLRVPAGIYTAEASHTKHAGTRNLFELDLRAGTKTEISVPLVPGCIISGRVVHSDGSPAFDGAIEVFGGRRNDFGPAGRIDNGAFRWTTTDEGPITLRAWPWRSAPTPARTFECRDGKRYPDVVLRVPDERPSLSGTIVDANGTPVPLAFLDIQPLDPFPNGQQERADASGTWHVYAMPPGRYRILASAPKLGVVDTMVVAPRLDLRLALGGTGRIAGTTTELVDGSLEVSFMHCGPADQPIIVARETRIVAVRGGRFSLDRAPACALTFAVRWRDRVLEANSVVEPDRTAYVDIDVGTPREKTVTGTVRDAAGSPVSGARVTAVLHEREAETVRTDSAGRYTLHTHSGAQLVAGHGEKVGRGTVGRANVASEQIDIVLDGAKL